MKINSIYKISNKPIIWLSTGAKNWSKLENKSNEKAYLLVHPMWEFSYSSFIPYQRHKRQLAKKNIELILLNNSKAEHRFAKFWGFRSHFLNQNLHACEHQFNIESQEKTVDAIYIAAAKPYKRIHLAEQIKSLYIITYFWPDVRDSEGNWDLHAFEPRIKHADFNKKRINATQIRTLLNQSKCGLALSKKEGAMWAIMEYLFCGIPVVTTKSVGGRDFFYDERFVEIVDDNPKAVQKGVESIISKKLSPELIRNETISKVEIERKKFYEVVKNLHLKHNTEIEDYQTFADRVWGTSIGIENCKIM